MGVWILVKMSKLVGVWIPFAPTDQFMGVWIFVGFSWVSGFLCCGSRKRGQEPGGPCPAGIATGYTGSLGAAGPRGRCQGPATVSLDGAEDEATHGKRSDQQRDLRDGQAAAESRQAAGAAVTALVSRLCGPSCYVAFSRDNPRISARDQRQRYISLVGGRADRRDALRRLLAGGAGFWRVQLIVRSSIL